MRLSESRDLAHWQKLGCVIRRNPENPIIRHNVAMNWIVRENDLLSSGNILKVQGRFLGAYHAYPSAGYESGPQ